MADFIEPDIEMDPVPEDNFIDTYRHEDFDYTQETSFELPELSSMILLLLKTEAP